MKSMLRSGLFEIEQESIAPIPDVEAAALGGIGVDLTLAEGRAVYSRVNDGALPTLLAQ